MEDGPEAKKQISDVDRLPQRNPSESPLFVHISGVGPFGDAAVDLGETSASSSIRSQHSSSSGGADKADTSCGGKGERQAGE